MRNKKYKYIEDLLDDYIMLIDEQIEIPLLIEKAQKKFNQNVNHEIDTVYKPGEAESLFKMFNQIKKHNERGLELVDELAEAENLLKEFLTLINGGKISYEKKDDNDKKMTFLFWLEEGQIKCNR